MTGTGRRGPGPSGNDVHADQHRAVPALLATDRLLTALVDPLSRDDATLIVLDRRAIVLI